MTTNTQAELRDALDLLLSNAEQDEQGNSYSKTFRSKRTWLAVDVGLLFRIREALPPAPAVGEVDRLLDEARDSAVRAERNHRPDPHCASTAASDAVEAYESVIRKALAALGEGGA